MSDSINQSLSILLPDASVAVFSRDAETRQSANALRDDWRFARVRFEIVEGDAAAAAEHFKSVASPDLLIVQTETTQDGFTAMLEDLAGACSENTDAVVIGPVNDVNLYRKLIDMGVADYLVKPIAANMLAEVIGKTLIARKGVSESRLIAFAGAKGGVGTSAIATACARICSGLLGRKTVLFDVAGGSSNLGVLCGFESTANLSTASRIAAGGDDEGLKRLLHKSSERLSVLATGSEPVLGVPTTDEQVEKLIDFLMARHPVVMVDLSHAHPDVIRMIVTRANHVVVVTTPVVASLRTARTLINEIRELRGKNNAGMELIVNMQGIAPAHEAQMKDIEAALEIKPGAVIPYAPKTFVACETEGRDISADKEGGKIIGGVLAPMLQRITGANPSPEQEIAGKSGFLSSLLGKRK